MRPGARRPTRPPAARALALEVLEALEPGLAHPENTTAPTLNTRLDEVLSRHPDLSAPERGLLRELTGGVLRWRGRLDYVIGRLSARSLAQLHPLVLQLLRLAAYQILFLDRVPASAAVNESVKLARARRLPPALTGFVNAVARKVAAAGKSVPLPDPQGDPVAALAAAQSLPAWLASRWLQRLGAEAAGDRARALNRPPPLVVRIIDARVSPGDLVEILAREGVAARPCRYSPVGLEMVTLTRPPLELPSYRQGRWLFQDEAAQLASLLLPLAAGDQVLEVGAGRGGKTTHLAQRLQGKGGIAALDLHPGRARELLRQAARMGLAGIYPLVADAAGALPFSPHILFDAVLLDAPCSGLGTLKRYPELRWRRREADIPRLAALQGALLHRAAPHVKPGGYLLYITCTTEPEENEDQVAAFLAAHPDFALAVDPEALPEAARGFLELPGYFRTRPERDDMDGFFGALMRRGG